MSKTDTYLAYLQSLVLFKNGFIQKSFCSYCIEVDGAGKWCHAHEIYAVKHSYLNIKGKETERGNTEQTDQSAARKTV